MKEVTYIQTDDNTTHLVKLLLLKINDLQEKVCTLSNPLELAQLFDEDSAAKLLDISKSSLITLRKEGRIHYRQIGNSIRYSLADVQEFEDRCRR